jgi:CRP/FNR family transcriptional regulator
MQDPTAQELAFRDDWTTRVEGLDGLEPEARAALLAAGTMATAPRGTVLFGPGRSPDTLILLLVGTVRVQQTSDTGREVFLYRVQAGETCVLTTACLLAREEYPAEGIAESDLRAILVPRSAFEDLLGRSPSFRRFVFATCARRITDLVEVIEEIAFRRVDVRLALKLLALAGSDGTVHATHQALAVELGTAREVVSRQLQEFQRRGWVALSRGSLTVTDRAALERLARA